MDEKAPDPGPDVGPVAFVLFKGVDYVRGWLLAARAVAELRAQLAASDLDGRLPELRAEVTVSGAGVVELGRVTPATAQRLARLLAQAHAQAHQAHGHEADGARERPARGERDRAA